MAVHKGKEGLFALVHIFFLGFLVLCSCFSAALLRSDLRLLLPPYHLLKALLCLCRLFVAAALLFCACLPIAVGFVAGEVQL